jgi:type IV secretion system protein VirB2
MVTGRTGARERIQVRIVTICSLLWPVNHVFAQASPLQTGADSVVLEFIQLATPLAIIAVMVLGLAALIGRLSWGAAVLSILGICIIFGAPQLVEWGRALFGV